MGPIGGEENRSQNNTRKNNLNGDLCNDATQKIDSQFSPGDGADDYLCGIKPSYDAFLLEDAFETQLVNVSGETQVMDCDGETQVLNGLDCLRSFPTDCDAEVEFAAVSDSEETNITDVLCDTQKASQHDDDDDDDDDVDSHSQKQSTNVFEASTDNYKKEEHNSGSIHRGFTAIRAATFRAAGLAARARATNGNSYSTKNDKSSLDQRKFEHDKETENLNNKKPCTAARKLFTEDEANMNGTDDNLDNTEFIDSENCVTGLSYVNSEQPGELSQANAIEVVEKFLEQNLFQVDQGPESGFHVAENPKLVSVVKASRDLAKISNRQKIFGVSGVYDWDDNREDEGGGDFFLKKKELFFDNGISKEKSLTEPKKQNRSDLRNIKSVGNYGDEERKTHSKRKLVDVARSVTKNLAEDLDGEMTLVSNDASKNIKVVDNIGPDTQIAAEAIDNLCFEVHLADDNANCKGTATNKSGNKAFRAEQNLTRKREMPSSVGVVTRRAQQAMNVDTSNKSSLLSVELPINSRNGQESEPGQRSVKEKRSFLQDQLGFTVPVAHRTRKKCTESNQSKDAETLVDAKKKINDLIDAPVPDPSSKKRRASENKNVQMITIEKLKKLRSTKCKQSSAPNLDELKLLSSKCSERIERNDRLEATPKQRVGTTFSNCTTPAARCTTPVNEASPVIMGDEFHKQSCRKNLCRYSLVREVNNLINGSPVSPDGMKEARKRRDFTSISVLFSQHLNADVIKQQKKILGRLGATVASSMSDATHFVADEFVRTRNMLEAIAFGKPVVTRLWLESCGQASCVIDEKNYILRDVKKEKEFGFAMPVSLSRACQHPLLQGQKVLVTPNTKPGKDILAILVKAVHGLAVERLGRSVLMGEKLPDDLLILSCEEDYDVCVPFLEKGGAVYSSELLLNGIVKQKLEYERHRLFEDHVKRTRSTIRVKKKNEHNLSVTKCSR